MNAIDDKAQNINQMAQTPMIQGDMTSKQVMRLLGLSPWTWRKVHKNIPRIVYPTPKGCKTVRYSMADVLHYRESCKQGGWINNDTQAE